MHTLLCPDLYEEKKNSPRSPFSSVFHALYSPDVSPVNTLYGYMGTIWHHFFQVYLAHHKFEISQT